MSSAVRGSLSYMGRLIYGFNVSVDGYIADAHGDIDWSEPSDELHQYWNDFERETALSFYGRRLYELMSAYWPTADQAADATPVITDFARIWRDMPKVVFSRTLDSVDWNSCLERGDPVEVVRTLKAETDGNLEVAGATLAAPIVRAGLVDEYRIVLAPTAVGGGTPCRPAVMDPTAPGGEPHLPRWRGPAALRGEARLIGPLRRANSNIGNPTAGVECALQRRTQHRPDARMQLRVPGQGGLDVGPRQRNRTAGTSRRNPTLIRTRGSASTLRHHCARWPKPAATT